MSSSNLSFKYRSSLGIQLSKAGLTNTAHTLIFFRIFLLGIADAGVVNCIERGRDRERKVVEAFGNEF